MAQTQPHKYRIGDTLVHRVTLLPPFEHYPSKCFVLERCVCEGAYGVRLEYLCRVISPGQNEAVSIEESELATWQEWADAKEEYINAQLNWSSRSSLKPLDPGIKEPKSD